MKLCSFNNLILTLFEEAIYYLSSCPEFNPNILFV